MNPKARIASFLAQGMKPSQVATICGVSAGYISQLLSLAKEQPDSEFALMLQEYAVKEEPDLTEDKILTNKYLAAEHAILDQMQGMIGCAELPALTNALRAVAERQEKRMSRLSAPAGQNVINNIIQLTLPAHAIPEHTINPQREVIKIGSQQLAPLSSEGVKSLFSQISEQKATLQLERNKQLTAGSEF